MTLEDSREPVQHRAVVLADRGVIEAEVHRGLEPDRIIHTLHGHREGVPKLLELFGHGRHAALQPGHAAPEVFGDLAVPFLDLSPQLLPHLGQLQA